MYASLELSYREPVISIYTTTLLGFRDSCEYIVGTRSGFLHKALIKYIHLLLLDSWNTLIIFKN